MEMAKVFYSLFLLPLGYALKKREKTVDLSHWLLQRYSTTNPFPDAYIEVRRAMAGRLNLDMGKYFLQNHTVIYWPPL